MTHSVPGQACAAAYRFADLRLLQPIAYRLRPRSLKPRRMNTCRNLPDNCWFLTGPTASGKTAVGLELAQRLGAEIISLDSMALYRGMDIGTAKPTPDERRAVPHHLIDVIEPDEEYSLAQYVAAAHDAAERDHRAGSRAAVCRRHAAVFEGAVARHFLRAAGRLGSAPPLASSRRNRRRRSLACPAGAGRRSVCPAIAPARHAARDPGAGGLGKNGRIDHRFAATIRICAAGR